MVQSSAMQSVQQLLKNNWLVVLLLTVIFGSAMTAWNLYQTIQNRDATIVDITAVKDAEIANHLKTIEEKDSELAVASSTIHNLANKLELTEEELDEVEDDYRKERNKNEEFEDQLDDLTDTLTDLDKLSKTDKELLQKYSKVSFLNEHYAPANLKEIDNEWKYDESREHQQHSDVMPFFEDMVEDAKDDNIDLWVVSAYRSFEYQQQLKAQYTVVYGSGANAFSADQGFSEHQLGTAIDFTTRGIGGTIEGFGGTPAYNWMLDNAHKYGFILSYPENNAYYVYEPWHWRFVGTDLAKDLHKDNAYFYDWEQREIDSYLLNIFD